MTDSTWSEREMTDRQMERMGELWRDASVVEGDLGSRYDSDIETTLSRRRTTSALRFWGTLTLESAVALAGVVYAVQLLASGAPHHQDQAIALLILLAMTTVLGLLSRRGQWRAADSSPRQTAALEWRRARGRRLGCRMGWIVLVAVVTFVFWSLRENGVELWSPRYAVLLVVTLAYVVLLVVLGKRAEREVAQSRELVDQLS